MDDYIGEPAQQYAYPEEATAAAYAQVQAVQQQQAAAAAAAAQGHMQIDNQVRLSIPPYWPLAPLLGTGPHADRQPGMVVLFCP